MPGVPKQRYVRMVWHLALPATRYRRALAAEFRELVEQRIERGSAAHTGLVRVVFESALATECLRAGMTARERALKVFSDLAVWDTEDNNGVLLYVLLADHAVEIVADRAAARRIDAAQWQGICESLAADFARGDYVDGTLAAIDAINQRLAAAFPAGAANASPPPPGVMPGR